MTLTPDLSPSCSADSVRPELSLLGTSKFLQIGGHVWADGPGLCSLSRTPTSEETPAELRSSELHLRAEKESSVRCGHASTANSAPSLEEPCYGYALECLSAEMKQKKKKKRK